MHVAVVILNWNTVDYLKKFIPGLLRSVDGEDAEVIVADSASVDGSMEMMAECFPGVRRIVLDSNYGFTGGYNRALGQVDADYFVLLNSDIEVPEGWLRPLTETLDRDPEVGVCAPKLHSWFDRDRFEYAGAAGGYLDSFCFPLCRGRIMGMAEKDSGQYDSPADVFWATGACLMVRSSLFRQLGGLDDRFFAHMEEIDFCWRVQLAGYRIRIVPDSVVYHIGGGTLPKNSPWKLKLNYRNNLLMMENNLARTYGLQMLRKSADIQKIAKRATRKADRRIFWRMVIDGCTGIAYLLMFRNDYFNAVVTAHREFRKLSARPAVTDVSAYLSGCGSAEVRGIYDRWMIPGALVLKEKIFQSVRNYFSGKPDGNPQTGR